MFVSDDDSISTVACEAKNPQLSDIVTRDTVELQIQCKCPRTIIRNIFCSVRISQTVVVVEV